MEAIWAAAGCLVTYFIFYRFYARYLGRGFSTWTPTDRPPPTS